MKLLLLILTSVVFIGSSILGASVVVSDFSSALSLFFIFCIASLLLIIVPLIISRILVLAIFVLISSSLFILPLVFVQTFIKACITAVVSTMIVVIVWASRLLLHLIVHVMLPYLILVSFGRVVHIVASLSA